jgi:hypothetical protein
VGGGAYFFLSRFYRGAGHSGMAAAWVIIGGEREARKKLLTMLEKSKVKKKFRKKNNKIPRRTVPYCKDLRLVAVTGECPANARQRHRTKCTLIPMPR